MGTRYLTELADWLSEAGLVVFEWGEWKTKGRSSGGFDPDKPWCVMWHHTASKTTPNNDASYCFDSAPDAPLANLLLIRDGSVAVGAAGATNTNGKGGPTTVSRGTIPKDAMNSYAVSVEAANDGVGENWPVAQIDSYFTINNTLADKLGFLPEDCLSHHAWAPDRKIDPARATSVSGLWVPASVNSSGTWSLDSIRDEAVRRSAGLPPEPPEPPEDDMLPIKVRFKGYLNVFLFGHGGYTHVTIALDEHFANVETVLSELHEQGVKSALAQSGITMADMIPSGEPIEWVGDPVT